MYTIKLRRGTSARWSTFDPRLAAGEPGYEIDTGLFKIGDGNSLWTELPYFFPGSDEDGPSLVLLYENAKV